MIFAAITYLTAAGYVTHLHRFPAGALHGTVYATAMYVSFMVRNNGFD